VLPKNAHMFRSHATQIGAEAPTEDAEMTMQQVRVKRRSTAISQNSGSTQASSTQSGSAQNPPTQNAHAGLQIGPQSQPQAVQQALLQMPVLVQHAVVKQVAKMGRQLAVVKAAAIFTYMLHMETNPILNKHINYQKNCQIEWDRLDGDPVAQRKFGLLHLRSFDMWVKELRSHLEYVKTQNTKEEDIQECLTKLQAITTWELHMTNLDMEDIEEEIKVFKLGGAFRSNQRKLEVCIQTNTPTWTLWKNVMVPFIKHCKGRKLTGVEPKGAQERIIQDLVDLLPRNA